MNKLTVTRIQEDPVIRQLNKQLRRINRELFFLKISVFYSDTKRNFLNAFIRQVINPIQRTYYRIFPVDKNS